MRGVRNGERERRTQDVEEEKEWEGGQSEGKEGQKMSVCVGKCVVCACVYADEICHPQQPPVKRNRISSPRGENLQECR